MFTLLKYAKHLNEVLEEYKFLHDAPPENIIANKGIGPYIRQIEFMSNEAVRLTKEVYE